MSIPLIPRKELLGNPDKAMARISRDGSQIAWLAPLDGVLNVWVAPRTDPSTARPVTADTGRGIRTFFWAFTNRHIVYMQDKNGDENWRLYRVDLQSNEVKDLTPFEGVQAQVWVVSISHPEEIIAGLNNRVPQLHDAYRLNVVTGELILLEQNPGFLGYTIDDEFRVLGAIQMLPDGGMAMLEKTPDGWQPWETIPQEDTLTTQTAGLNKDSTCMYLLDSRGRNTSALFEKNLATHAARLLAEDSLVDAGDVILHPTEKHVQAVSFTYTRKRWVILDPAIEPDLAFLRTVADGEVEITSRSLDDQYWTVAFLVDNGPARTYLYDRAARQVTFLFTNRSALEKYPLAKMHPVVIKSRDGLDLVAYYSLPVGSDSNNDGIPDQPLPLVFEPHGGPWGRDVWGFNPWHQWMTNRGYAVLMANFRSSTGFGKAFTNAGDREWGRKIMEDQVDAVKWAIAQGIADPQKVAVMGGSFGGYSTLAGLTFTPTLFACGVDIVGPSNLVTLLQSIPEYWKPMLELFTSRVGDHRTEEGRKLLLEHSPITHVERICRPLLIGQGANDPRVKQAESDQIVQAMQSRGIPVTYVLFLDEGHGFARPENNIAFCAVSEAFLSKVLGGRFEPVGEDFKGSSIKVLAGVGDVPGLAEALS